MLPSLIPAPKIDHRFRLEGHGRVALHGGGRRHGHLGGGAALGDAAGGLPARERTLDELLHLDLVRLFVV